MNSMRKKVKNAQTRSCVMKEEEGRKVRTLLRKKYNINPQFVAPIY